MALVRRIREKDSKVNLRKIAVGNLSLPDPSGVDVSKLAKTPEGACFPLR